MPERVTTNPRAEYLAIVNQSPRMQTWHEFHERRLPEMIQSPTTRKHLRTIIHYYLKNLRDLSPETPLPEIQWVDNEPVVRQLTGGSFMVPVLEFPEEMLPVFNYLVGESNGAGTFTFPIELASLGELDARQSTNSQIVLLPHRGRQYSVPYGERRRHELTHAVDPLVDTREQPGGILMQEIIAIIGSFSDPANRGSQIVLNPPYIIPYLMRELEQSGIDRISEADFFQMVNLINDIVYNSTHILPKIPNDQITRRIMRCRSLDELTRSWPELFQ